MRRVEEIIDMARKLSQNTSYSQSNGVPQDVFVQYLNNAQDALTMEVTNLKTKYFKKQTIVDVVPNQEVYPYPDDCLIQHLDTIQWTDSPSGTYWQSLYKTTTKEKITLRPGYPFAYIPFEDGIYFNPPIQRGKLYITYVREPKRLQKRSGKVQTFSVISGKLLNLTVDINEQSFDLSELKKNEFLCLVDKLGNVKISNIPYTCVNDLGQLQMNFTLGTVQPALGDYVICGQDVINKPEWPDLCEGYLIKHMVYEAKYSDSSAWSDAAVKDMQMHFMKLSNIFATMSDDITAVVINNLDYIGF